MYHIQGVIPSGFALPILSLCQPQGAESWRTCPAVLRTLIDVNRESRLCTAISLFPVASTESGWEGKKPDGYTPLINIVFALLSDSHKQHQVFFTAIASHSRGPHRLHIDFNYLSLIPPPPPPQ